MFTINRWTVISIYCLMAAVLFSGCAARTNYKVLSFFFDGVPDPDKVVAKAEQKDDATGTTAQKGSTHGPFASRNCEGCHQRGMGNQLVLPVEKLCFKCHNLEVEKAKWVHGPVAAGGCRVCHNPHRSGYPYLLDASLKEVCFRCHEESSVMKNAAHEDISAGCTGCHNAHASDQKFLLK